MTANTTTVFVTEQSLLARIKSNPKGKLMLDSSNGMRLSVLLTAFGQEQADEALLKKHPNLQKEDLAAAHLYARKLARGEKVELPSAQTAKIIPMPTAKTQPTKPITNQPTKAGAIQHTDRVNVIPTRPVTSYKTPSAPKPAEKPLVKPEPPNSSPVQPAKPLPTESFCYKDKLNLKDRITSFGVEMVKLYQILPQTIPAQVLGDQVFRSGTSVGAHYREAMFARTPSEFISKLQVGLQELEESKHWFQLLAEGGIVEASRLVALRQEADEITAILIATVNLTKTRPGEK